MSTRLTGRLRHGACLTSVFITLLMTVPFNLQADPGNGWTTRGNQLNPQAESPALIPDPIGLNPFNLNSRSITGLLYEDVMKRPDLIPLGGSDWAYNLSVEAGYLASLGKTDTASFREYGDWSENPILNRFDVALENQKTAKYINVSGGGVGRDDQYVNFSIGKYGRYDFAMAFDSIPHIFSTNARVLWDGSGTGNLKLPAGLKPGASSREEVISAFQSIGESTLALKRDKIGISLDFNPAKRLELYAHGFIEWRNGSRPFGGAFSYPNAGGLTETVEPIDYTTYDADLGLRYSGSKYQVNLGYKGSFFRNHIETLTWENPGLLPFIAPAGISLVPNMGRFSLAPDNDYHNLNGDFAMRLPFWRGRTTAMLSWSKGSQNSTLIPPAIGTDVIGFPSNGIDLDFWNSVNALSTRKIDAEVEYLKFHTRTILNPTGRLRLNGNFVYQNRDNHTAYTAFNPLTGEYGYPALDGGLGSLFPGDSGIFNPAAPGSRVRYRNIPQDMETISFSLGAEYQLTNAVQLNAAYEREHKSYNHREVGSFTENRARMELSARKMDWGMLRLSYLFTDRSNDDYNYDPYEAFYTSSLPGYTGLLPQGDTPPTLSALRIYDVAGANVHEIKLKLNRPIGERMDVMITGGYKNEDYSADYGLKDTSAFNANLEWNYQFALNGLIYAYYSFQRQKRNVANITDAGPFGTDPRAGGTVYPLENVWSESVKENNHTFGAGFNVSIRALTFDLNYSFVSASSGTGYQYASPSAYLNRYPAQVAGSGFPDQTYRHHLLEANLRWFIREGTDLRLLYRFEREHLDDFHYRGLTQPVVGNDIFLLAVPEDYSAHIIGITIETNL